MKPLPLLPIALLISAMLTLDPQAAWNASKVLSRDALVSSAREKDLEEMFATLLGTLSKGGDQEKSATAACSRSQFAEFWDRHIVVSPPRTLGEIAGNNNASATQKEEPGGVGHLDIGEPMDPEPTVHSGAILARIASDAAGEAVQQQAPPVNQGREQDQRSYRDSCSLHVFGLATTRNDAVGSGCGGSSRSNKAAAVSSGAGIGETRDDAKGLATTGRQKSPDATICQYEWELFNWQLY
jgi:hypothetical protein